MYRLPLRRLPRLLTPTLRSIHTSLPRPYSTSKDAIPRPYTDSPTAHSPPGQAPSMTPATHWVHPSVSYEQVRALADQPSDNVLLIDVREPEEVAQGSIPSSLSLPLSQLQRALHLTPGEFQHTFNFSKPEPEQQVVFYCRSGKRSLSACDLAKREGWDVRNYDGSWLDWVAREQERGRGA